MSLSLETVLQLLLLMALAAFVPLRLARLLAWRLRSVPVNLLISALILWLAGAAMMVLPYLLGAPHLLGSVASDPLGAASWAGRLGAMSAIAWAPILALTLLVIAQKIAQNPDRRARIP